MAEAKKAAAAEKPTKAATESAPKAKEYTLEQLAPYCLKVFGVTSSTFNGATASLDASKTYTKEFVKEHIQKWSKKGVK